MNKAIALAVEGGYVGVADSYRRFYGIYTAELQRHLNLVLIDPLFWQALGRAVNEPNSWWWRESWHSCIDHLGDGGNIDEFFKTLLK